MRGKKRKHYEFNISKFIISFAVWITGAVFSLLPVILSFIYNKSKCNEMNLYSYVFKSSDIMYACVSMTIVAVSDIVSGMLRERKNSTLNIVFIILSAIYIFIGSATYTLYEYSSQEYAFMIKYNYRYFWLVVISCIIMYITKNWAALESEE